MTTNNDTQPIAVLFVWLGNICRSPLAEAALRAIAEREKLDIIVDSAGIGDWHIGHAPDARAQEIAQKLGCLSIGTMQARQVKAEDFQKFDHILAMDTSNFDDLRAMQPPGSKAQLSMFLDYLPGHQGGSVADPYYGDERDFEACWQQVSAAAEGFVQALPPPAPA